VSGRWSPIRRSGLGATAVAVLLAGCGDHAPRRQLEPVRLDSTLVAEALTKQVAASSGELGALLARDPIDLRLERVTRQGMTLRDVAIRRRGREAAGEATVDPAQVAAVAPVDVDLRHDPGAPGEGIVFRGTASVLGIPVAVTVRVLAQDGAVVAIPEGLPIGRTVLFSDPRVVVRSVSARPVPGGLRVRAEATIR
jgi:hypothetical protein